MNIIKILQITILVLLTSTIIFASAEPRVVESTFCLKMDKPDCSIPAVTQQIKMSDILTIEDGIKILYFWTSIAVSEDKTIVHVWSESDSIILGVKLSISKSPRFRTYSKIIAKPGIYRVEVRDPNSTTLSGGESKTITILPPE